MYLWIFQQWEYLCLCLLYDWVDVLLIFVFLQIQSVTLQLIVIQLVLYIIAIFLIPCKSILVNLGNLVQLQSSVQTLSMSTTYMVLECIYRYNSHKTLFQNPVWSFKYTWGVKPQSRFFSIWRKTRFRFLEIRHWCVVYHV